MIKEISLSDIISNRTLDGNWRDMTETERTEALEKIKQVLFNECRGTNTKIYKAISRMSITNLPTNYGILDRLTISGYCAGQSYPDEMRTVKQIIVKEC